MATISTNNLVHAIYESSINKEGRELDDVMENAVKLISEKHLLSKSKEILNKLEQLIDKKEESARVKICSRKKLDKHTTDEIEKFIKERYKVKNVIFLPEINDKLLGGIRIEVGDEVMDLTLKNKIHKLKNYLINN